MTHSKRRDWLRLINSLEGKDRSKSRQNKKPTQNRHSGQASKNKFI